MPFLDVIEPEDEEQNLISKDSEGMCMLHFIKRFISSLLFLLEHDDIEIKNMIVEMYAIYPFIRKTLVLSYCVADTNLDVHTLPSRKCQESVVQDERSNDEKGCRKSHIRRGEASIAL